MVYVSVHWLVQCHTICPSSCRYFQESTGIKHKMTEGRQLVSASCRNWTHLALLIVLASTTQPWVCINWLEKLYSTCHFSNLFFACRIAQVEYQGQSGTVWPDMCIITLGHKPCNGSSSSSSTSKWEMRTWNLGLIFFLSRSIIDGWSVTK